MLKSEKIIDDIIKRIAKENNINPKIVSKVYESVFRFTANVIKSSVKGDPDTFKSVMLPRFGKFYPKSAKEIIKKTKRRAEQEARGGTKRRYILIDSTESLVPKSKVEEDDNR